MIDANSFTTLTHSVINLDKVVVTDSLGTISRWNIISRWFHSDSLNSENIAGNIHDYMSRNRHLLKRLDAAGKENLIQNLSNMQEKFSKNPLKAAAIATSFERALACLEETPAPSSKTHVRRRRRAPAHDATVQQARATPQVSSALSTPSPMIVSAPAKDQRPNLPPAIARTLGSDPSMEAQRKIVEAISKRTVGQTTVTVSSGIPEAVIRRRIELETAGGLTQTERRNLYPGTPQDIAIVKDPHHVFAVPRYIRLKWDPIKQVVVTQTSGSFDVGARLRETHLHPVRPDILVH